MTFDGEPVGEGSLTMIPAKGTKGPTAGASVSDGRYRIPADSGPAVGNYVVQITARRKTGRKTTVARGPYAQNPTQIDQSEQYLPARYNTQTELTVEIAPGENEHNFELIGSP